MHSEHAPHHRWLDPFIQLLRQGVSPNRIALAIALGIVLGVTPVLGSTLILCTVAAVVLRLNLPAIQLVSTVVFPLQFILLVPFYKMGAWMFGADASTLSLQGIAASIRHGQGVEMLWLVTVHALVAWSAVGALSVAILYAVLVPLVRRLWRTAQSSATSPPGG